MSFWLRVLLFWPFVTYAKERRRCLRNIDCLERDLFGIGAWEHGFQQILSNFYGEPSS